MSGDVYTARRIEELEQQVIRAQADLFAREEAARTARSNLSFFVGALEEARRFAMMATGAANENSLKEMNGNG